MEFGVQFFPDVGPEEKTAAEYYAEYLEVGAESERLGFTHGRTVEHYSHPYCGYSPNPLIFLTALALRTKKMRLVTGAVLPVFNNPLKLAGEIGMVDALSGGRLDVGFARALCDAFQAQRRRPPIYTGRQMMGEDPWPYGVEPNRKALDTCLRYHYEQGISQRRWTVDEIFAPETLAIIYLTQ